MAMDKYGISGEVLHEELRNEEANLMQQMQRMLSDPEKTANDKSAIESRLIAVRNKITELDLKK